MSKQERDIKSQAALYQMKGLAQAGRIMVIAMPPGGNGWSTELLTKYIDRILKELNATLGEIWKQTNKLSEDLDKVEKQLSNMR